MSSTNGNPHQDDEDRLIDEEIEEFRRNLEVINNTNAGFFNSNDYPGGHTRKGKLRPNYGKEWIEDLRNRLHALS